MLFYGARVLVPLKSVANQRAGPAFKNNPTKKGHTPKAPVWAMGRETRLLMSGPRSPWEIFTLTSTKFEAFGFAEPLSRALTQCGYETPTPIQVQALPPQLEGRDLLGLAETGSGKTAAFVLPILQQIAKNPVELGWKQVYALVLAPTRELAIQIDQEVASLSRNLNIRRAVVLGGVSKGPQINALKRGVHVLVATPGRLLDHVNMRTCDLSGVNVLVLDEADRMFDMGFIRDIKKIAGLIPVKRRTAMFSATMPPEIRTLAYDLLKDPYRVDLSTKTMVVDRIDQKVMIVRTAEKQSRLHTILNDEACKRVIVFTRTKRGADRVAERLAMAGIGATAFHGNKAQNARQRALNDFTAGHVRVLVATDIAARGIDVSNVTHVINFDMPMEPETYIHRVGRTARKGESGIAISLCDQSEMGDVKAIERLMKQKIEVISDIGGENLPMPEKRPHHAHTDPRRTGAHRKGPERGRHDGPRSNRPRREDGRSDKPVQAGGYNPAARISAPSDDAPHAEKPRHDGPRRDGHRGPRTGGDRPERRSHEGRGPRSDAPRSDAPRHERPRHDGPRPERSERPDRAAAEARGARPEWKRDGQKTRSDGPRHEGPRHDGPRQDGQRREGVRSDKPHGASHAHHGKPSHGAPHRGERSNDTARSGGANPKNWDGQSPPKFLKQRSVRGTGRPNSKPAA